LFTLEECLLRLLVFLRQAAVATALVFSIMAAHAVLKPGDKAPLFTTEAALGGEAFQFQLAQALARGPVVLYFYPKAFTSGCTYEANLFAQASERFESLGATVIGVSSDDIDTLKRFSVEACRNKFAVGADKDARIIRAYKAQMASFTDMASRISYVISTDGRIVHVHQGANPEGHVDSTLKVVERLRSAKER
jgi:thioredoxin-dependent peroxiredoxin